MTKMRALLTGTAAAGALAMGALIPAHAANVIDEDLGGAGHVTVDSYGWAALTLDGGAGYLSVYGHLPHQEADVCVGTDEASATCLADALPAAPGVPSAPGVPGVPGVPTL